MLHDNRLDVDFPCENHSPWYADEQLSQFTHTVPSIDLLIVSHILYIAFILPFVRVCLLFKCVSILCVFVDLFVSVCVCLFVCVFVCVFVVVVVAAAAVDVDVVVGVCCVLCVVCCLLLLLLCVCLCVCCCCCCC